jgi:hypothetical protein
VASQPVFQLHIQLKSVEPTVWRRLLVPADVTLGELLDPPPRPIRGDAMRS